MDFSDLFQKPLGFDRSVRELRYISAIPPSNIR
jgi:hypothetical protein